MIANEPWLYLRFAMHVSVVLLGQGSLVGVAATIARRRTGQGWVWLVAAGGLGVLEMMFGAVSNIVISAWASSQGVDVLIRTNAVTGIVGSLLHLTWWGLLLYGIVLLCSSEERPPESGEP